MDAVNSIFLLLASIFILDHCRVLYKDKQARGVSLVSNSFFVVYNLWGVLYFTRLDQKLSVVASIFTFAVNLLWVIMILYYNKKEKNNGK